MRDWQKARIIENSLAAEDMRSIVVAPKQWIAHKAGQHYEVRIAGTDISRKYSVASSPLRRGVLEFGVQYIPNGLVSPKLWALKPGDEIEIRGPWGESFIWEPALSGPLVLLGAGSGITPLLCIYDSYRAAYPDHMPAFIMSAKNEHRIMHYEKYKNNFTTRLTAREGRIDKNFLAETIGTVARDSHTRCYVCGPEGFIDAMVDDLLDLGFQEAGIRSEKFI